MKASNSHAAHPARNGRTDGQSLMAGLPAKAASAAQTVRWRRVWHRRCHRQKQRSPVETGLLL